MVAKVCVRATIIALVAGIYLLGLWDQGSFKFPQTTRTPDIVDIAGAEHRTTTPDVTGVDRHRPETLGVDRRQADSQGTRTPQTMRDKMGKTGMGETMSETQETMGKTQDDFPPDEAVGRTAELLGEHDQPRRGWQGTTQKTEIATPGRKTEVKKDSETCRVSCGSRQSESSIDISDRSPNSSGCWDRLTSRWSRARLVVGDTSNLHTLVVTVWGFLHASIGAPGPAHGHSLCMLRELEEARGVELRGSVGGHHSRGISNRPLTEATGAYLNDNATASGTPG
jgi:hypothetical protein